MLVGHTFRLMTDCARPSHLRHLEVRHFRHDAREACADL